MMYHSKIDIKILQIKIKIKNTLGEAKYLEELK